VARRIRHHVNPLKVDYLAIGAERIALPAQGPVEVELGCADACWLFERAAAQPDLTLVGLEIRAPLVGEVNRRAAASGLGGRLRAVYANISLDLENLFAGGSVDRFVVNFPDPWFKRRQHKRRLVTDALAHVLWRQLRSGGEVFFQSDVWALALEAMAVLEAADAQFENVRGPWSFLNANPFGAHSKREQQCVARARPIWRLLYRKRALRPQ